MWLRGDGGSLPHVTPRPRGEGRGDQEAPKRLPRDSQETPKKPKKHPKRPPKASKNALEAKKEPHQGSIKQNSTPMEI